jgi:hypothetical protein
VNVFEVVKPTASVRWKIRDSRGFCELQYVYVDQHTHTLGPLSACLIICALQDTCTCTLKHMHDTADPYMHVYMHIHTHIHTYIGFWIGCSQVACSCSQSQRQ